MVKKGAKITAARLFSVIITLLPYWLSLEWSGSRTPSQSIKPSQNTPRRNRDL